MIYNATIYGIDTRVNSTTAGLVTKTLVNETAGAVSSMVSVYAQKARRELEGDVDTVTGSVLVDDNKLRKTYHLFLKEYNFNNTFSSYLALETVLNKKYRYLELDTLYPAVTVLQPTGMIIDTALVGYTEEETEPLIFIDLFFKNKKI